MLTHYRSTHAFFSFVIMEYETIYGQVVGKANNYQCVPSADGSKRIIKNAKLRAYERTFAKQITKYKGRGIKGRFRLFIDIWQSSTVYDLDNSIKTVLDCLQYAEAITDDNLCYQIRACKHIDKSRPRIRFAIEELNPELSLFSSEI